jgi:ribose transport system substrate-binding protein
MTNIPTVGIQHVVTKRQKFLDGLVALTRENLETGNIAYEGIHARRARRPHADEQ